MINDCLLLLILLVCSWTDWRTGKILNKVTYPAIAGSFLIGLVAYLFQDAAIFSRWLGVPFEERLVGFVGCGLLMVVAFVVFAGAVGGGDVKLLALVGSYLGIYKGLEVLLWTFVFGAAFGIIQLIWLHGAWNLVRKMLTFVTAVWRSQGQVRLDPEERKPMQKQIFLGPSTLLAFVVVRLLDWFPL